MIQDTEEAALEGLGPTPTESLETDYSVECSAQGVQGADERKTMGLLPAYPWLFAAGLATGACIIYLGYAYYTNRWPFPKATLAVRPVKKRIGSSHSV